MRAMENGNGLMAASRSADGVPPRGSGSPLARHFAAFAVRLAGAGASSDLELAADLLCRRMEEGDICLDLEAFQGGEVEVDGGARPCPALGDWRRALLGSRVVAEPGGLAPLVLDGTRLYLHRYWEFERRVIVFIDGGLGAVCQVDHGLLRDGLRRYFSQAAQGEVDWQVVAALAAVLRPFCVVTGGAGTGKTSTVVKILALLLEQWAAAGRACRIMLAAPTGKAAARLQEAVVAAKGGMGLPPGLAALIPDQAATLHRLLGAMSGGAVFRHHRGNPLSADVVVVDEASMVDLPMMARLVDALGPGCRLILLGDRNQLASVEPGSVFADICQPEGLARFSTRFAETLQSLSGMALDGGGCGPLCDSLVELRHSYRFARGGGVERLGRAVLAGDVDECGRLLADPDLSEVVWREVADMADLQAALAGLVRQGFYGYLGAAEPAEAFAGFGRFMLLGAVRQGGFGVESVNRQIEGLLRRPEAGRGEGPRALPFMVVRNDYNLGLYNGDIGICLSAGNGGGTVYFQRPGGGMVAVPEYRLPPAEKAFAMTVHKSQGSEFERVVVLLPDAVSPVLSRELLYTAITRARQGLEIWGRREVLAAAVRAVVRRDSGLRELVGARTVRE